MPATVTLGTTALSAEAAPSDRQVKVVSTSGLATGTRLFVDSEMMTVAGFGVGNWVNVLRGVDGTAAQLHDAGATAWIGRADQFFSSDPVGAPRDAILVSPHINTTNGAIWFALGDGTPEGQTNRWWSKQSTTHSIGALGVNAIAVDPQSST
jgi:hypothetical protein